MTPYASQSSSLSPEMTSSSLSLLWQLIETTPASLSEFDSEDSDEGKGSNGDNNGDIIVKKESEILSSQLDTIQAALAVCEIMQCYMAPPPLYFLIGTYQELENLKIDCHIRVIKKQFIKELLKGCGFLIAGLNAIIHTSSSQNEVEDFQDFYVDEYDKKVFFFK
jgi:hypothetical protein